MTSATKVPLAVVVVVAVLCVVSASAMKKPLLSQLPCPRRWLHRPADDRCYRLFPIDRPNATMRTAMNYDEAAEYCRVQHNAELPMAHNRSSLNFMMDLAGRKTGRTFWLAVRHDRSKPGALAYPTWIYPDTTRPYPVRTSFFDWDKKRGMPDGEECIAVQMAGDRSKRILGGNNKMVSVNCYTQLSVMCVKDRYPARINGVNGTDQRTIQAVWRKDLWLQIHGKYIPNGTRVSLQTTSDASFATGPNLPTNCTKVPRVTGGSLPVVITNVTTDRRFQKLCNGTCDSAIVYIPRTLPFVRGAKYSICFFLPSYDKPSPIVDQEYALNLVPNVFVEWVQLRREFLEDTCKRHQHSVDLFFGDRRLDTNRDKVSPFYFTSNVGG